MDDFELSSADSYQSLTTCDSDDQFCTYVRNPLRIIDFNEEEFCFNSKKAWEDLRKSKTVTYEEAAAGTEIPVRVYADGIFDLFHFGHAKALMQAKNVFPNVHLVVGVCNDTLTHSMKGYTVMTDTERYESVRHCKYVDEVIEDAPWSLAPEFLIKHKIDFVAHDDIPYNAGGCEDVYKNVKDIGMFVATKRTQNISTTDLILRIIKNYDVYVRRNLMRGYTRKDMNVGFLKNCELKFRSRLDIIKRHSTSLLYKWERKRNELISDFLKLFNGPGTVAHLLNKSKKRVAKTSTAIYEALSPVRSLFEDDYADYNSS